MHRLMKLLKKGAEGDIFLTSWNKKKAILKARKNKSCREIGRIVGVMHKNGIMHGDLTTSNFIVSNGKMFVLDFGLANKTKKPEDHAVDLRLFKEILTSAHVKIMNKDNVTNPL